MGFNGERKYLRDIDWLLPEMQLVTKVERGRIHCLILDRQKCWCIFDTKMTYTFGHYCIRLMYSLDIGGCWYSWLETLEKWKFFGNKFPGGKTHSDTVSRVLDKQKRWSISFTPRQFETFRHCCNRLVRKVRKLKVFWIFFQIWKSTVTQCSVLTDKNTVRSSTPRRLKPLLQQTYSPDSGGCW